MGRARRVGKPQDRDATLAPEEAEHHGRCTACAQLYSSARATRSALELKAWRAQLTGTCATSATAYPGSIASGPRKTLYPLRRL